jgi:hypothetical protein
MLKPTLWDHVYFGIMATYSLGDLIAVGSAPSAASKAFSYTAPGGITFMYIFTILGAGTFAVAHLLKPDFFGLRDMLGGRVDASFIYADMFIASTFGGFAVCCCVALTNRDATAWAPVLKFQGIYKTLWCAFFVCALAAGKFAPCVWDFLYFGIMFVYALGDYIFVGIKSHPRADTKSKSKVSVALAVLIVAVIAAILLQHPPSDMIATSEKVAAECAATVEALKESHTADMARLKAELRAARKAAEAAAA